MKNKSFIPVNVPLIGGKEKEYIVNCLDTGWISSEGPYVKEFEEKFSSVVDRKYGIAVCNGSAALDIAVAALNLGKGDEVIMPAFTIISCAAAIIRSGATPVLVDSDPDTWNMDVNQVKEKISDRTRAIMVVHIYGLPVDMDPILELASEYGLKIIEDAAEMHGQTYKGRPCGSFGDVSTFSFYPNKHITTGEGGMLVTNDEKIAERSRSLRNLCFQNEKRFVHEEIGWNYRITNLQAALGVAQLERLEKIIEKKREIGESYNKLLRNVSGINLPLSETSYAKNIYWVYGIILKDDVDMNALEFMSLLGTRGIGTRPFFYPMHLQPVFRKEGMFKNEEYPVAEKLYNRGFYIPSGLAITNEQIEIVSNNIKELL